MRNTCLFDTYLSGAHCKAFLPTHIMWRVMRASRWRALTGWVQMHRRQRTSRHWPRGGYICKYICCPLNNCKSWPINKAECQRIDASKLWCWRRLLRVPWTARRSNQSILKEIGPCIFIFLICLPVVYLWFHTILIANVIDTIFILLNLWRLVL